VVFFVFPAWIYEDEEPKHPSNEQAASLNSYYTLNCMLTQDKKEIPSTKCNISLA
jgi:hypothetical protein